METSQIVSRDDLKEKGFPAPVDITLEIKNSLSDEQNNIMLELIKLADRSEKLAKLRPPPPGGAFIKDGALIPCEDEDDLKVITLGPRRELEKDIKRSLNEALDAGLGFLGFIQRQCKNHGVKP